jgi:hypothetical protein
MSTAHDVGRRRWDTLMDRRAGELLASAVATPALVLASPGGFPLQARRPRGLTVLVTPGAECPVAGAPQVLGRAPGLPFTSGSFAAVLDTARPEEPRSPESAAHALAELARVCRPGGRIGVVACGGTSSDPGGGRGVSVVVESLRRAGCEIERLVPFDVLAPFSPLRPELGPRFESVLEELDEHLRHPGVEAVVRLLDERIVSALPGAAAGRVLVLARVRSAAASAHLWSGGGAREIPPGRAASPTAFDARVLYAADVMESVLRSIHDDAVTRFAAFLDTEVLPVVPTDFDLATYLADIGTRERNAAAVAAELERRRRRWYPGLEMLRLLTAGAYRMTRATVAALREPGEREGESLADTLDYEIFGSLDLEACLARPPECA